MKIKAALLARQRHEAEALHAVQKTEWILKYQVGNIQLFFPKYIYLSQGVQSQMANRYLHSTLDRSTLGIISDQIHS